MNTTARTSKKPEWLKVRLPSDPNFFHVSEILKSHRLHTICQSARCPNTGECWSRKTATFLILGDICTRSCSFCAVTKGTPSPLDEDEPAHIAEVISSLGLKYAVITSVTRDDLKDGGARGFARTLRAIREKSPQTRIEVLIPDFNGSQEALDSVLDEKPDILNHNLETTEPLYPVIQRPGANYKRSLAVLASAKKRKAVTKSGLMIGLGEERKDIIQTMSDLHRSGCDLLTIGQYLPPSPVSAPVKKYFSPLEFEQLRNIALDFGFVDVAAGPLVRSSFRAESLYQSALERI